MYMKRTLKQIIKEDITSILQEEISVDGYAVNEKSNLDNKSKTASDIQKKLNTEKDPLNKLKLRKAYAMAMAAKFDAESKYNKKMTEGWKKSVTEISQTIKNYKPESETSSDNTIPTKK